MMLGKIANFCLFQSSGIHFLDLADVMLDLEEKPDDLYQYILAFIDDNEI